MFSDSEQGKADATYVHDVAKAQTLVTIHDGSPYAQQLQQVIADNFKQLGGKVLSQEAIAPTDVDMHPLLTRIASEKPDLIYFPVFTAAAAQILRQAKETPGLEKAALIGGGSLLSADFIEAAGPVRRRLPHRLSRPVAGRDGQGLSEVRRGVQEGVRRGADLRLPRQRL